MLSNIIYFLIFLLFLIGIFTMLSSKNYLRSLFGLVIFQNAVLLFYIAVSKVRGGIAPIIVSADVQPLYTSPVGHVLMLTAIVVGFATLAVALSLIYRIKQNFGSIEFIARK